MRVVEKRAMPATHKSFRHRSSILPGIFSLSLKSLFQKKNDKQDTHRSSFT